MDCLRQWDDAWDGAGCGASVGDVRRNRWRRARQRRAVIGNTAQACVGRRLRAQGCRQDVHLVRQMGRRSRRPHASHPAEFAILTAVVVTRDSPNARSPRAEGRLPGARGSDWDDVRRVSKEAARSLSGQRALAGVDHYSRRRQLPTRLTGAVEHPRETRERRGRRPLHRVSGTFVGKVGTAAAPGVNP